MTTSGSLDALAQWYAAHCNGQWEHQSGIKLSTIDNPGWRLQINLADTELQHIPFAAVEYQLKDEISWWRCWRDEAAFHAACGVNNLNAVIDVFIAWAHTHRSTVTLLHEVWIESDECGQALESCCLAGPDGDGHRRLLGPGARLVHTFRAGSHYEAMTIYHRLLGREPFTTEHARDYEPYPAEWLERQQSKG